MPLVTYLRKMPSGCRLATTTSVAMTAVTSLLDPASIVTADDGAGVPALDLGHGQRAFVLFLADKARILANKDGPAPTNLGVSRRGTVVEGKRTRNIGMSRVPSTIVGFGRNISHVLDAGRVGIIALRCVSDNSFVLSIFVALYRMCLR